MISNTYVKYTQEDIEFIRQNYPTKGSEFCAKVLNRTLKGISKTAKRYGIKADLRTIMQNSEKVKVARDQQVKYLQQFNSFITDPKEIQNIKDLYLAGVSSNEIASMYECSKTPILKILKETPKRLPRDYANHHSKTQGSGTEHHSWKGGYKDVYNRFRDLQKYFDWRKAVLSRDGNKCTGCDSTDCLQSHHSVTLKTLINEYATDNNKRIDELTHDDLRSDFFYDLSNGVTYCEDCHKDYHKTYGRD